MMIESDADCRLFQANLYKLAQSTSSHWFTISATKSYIGTKLTASTYCSNGQPLPIVDYSTHMGITVDSIVKFLMHLNTSIRIAIIRDNLI